MVNLSKTFVISLGGSVIIPDEPDKVFLNAFRDLILDYSSKGNKFVIFCGGGKTAREYQNYAKAIGIVSKDNLDWIGIYATRLNASLVKAIFEGSVNEDILTNPTEKIVFKENIKIASGWKPGWSTDYDAVLVAKQLKAKSVINITNVDFVYDKDPRKFPDAKAIKKICWKELRKMFPHEWKPGLNSPFDPVASKEAEKSEIEVCIAGKDLKNLRRILDGKEFSGTRIK